MSVNTARLPLLLLAIPICAVVLACAGLDKSPGDRLAGEYYAAIQERLVSPDGSYPPDPQWWAPLLETPVGPSARLGMTHVGSTDLGASHRIFADLLHGDVRAQDSYIDLAWPSGIVRVHPADRPGVMGMSLHGSSVGEVEIGQASCSGSWRLQPRPSPSCSSSRRAREFLCSRVFVYFTFWRRLAPSVD